MTDVPHRPTAEPVLGYVIQRTLNTQGVPVVPEERYWHFEEGTKGGFSEGWKTFAEATRYPSRNAAEIAITARQLYRYTVNGGLLVIAVPKETIRSWESVVEEVSEAIEPTPVPVEPSSPSNGRTISTVLISSDAFDRIVRALILDHDLNGKKGAYSYRIENGIVTEYATFRTLQPNSGGGAIMEFHFDDNWDIVYSRAL
jgi:hypothetical protein